MLSVWSEAIHSVCPVYTYIFICLHLRCLSPGTGRFSSSTAVCLQLCHSWHRQHASGRGCPGAQTDHQSIRFYLFLNVHFVFFTYVQRHNVADTKPNNNCLWTRLQREVKLIYPCKWQGWAPCNTWICFRACRTDCEPHISMWPCSGTCVDPTTCTDSSSLVAVVLQ